MSGLGNAIVNLCTKQTLNKDITETFVCHKKSTEFDLLFAVVNLMIPSLLFG